MGETRVRIGGLQVAAVLADFVNHELLPILKLEPQAFWAGFESLIDDFSPRNAELLATRDRLQARIDDWHRKHRGARHDTRAYQAFLKSIGYLEDDVDDFTITTARVDQEIANLAGPQLVVPVKNARFALNAANARWGSLYDALYGTDVISEDDGARRGSGYNPVRGSRVVSFVRDFLDNACPLKEGHYRDIQSFSVADDELCIDIGAGQTTLARPAQFRGYRGSADSPTAILLSNNGLHIELELDRTALVGSQDRAGINDVILEAALTTIQDCEDSVAAVDALDKVTVYRNWLGLIRGNLTETFDKGGAPMTRILNMDRQFTAPGGETLSLPGRSLLLVRNVGHLMRNNAVIDSAGNEIFEGLMDAMITSAIAALDVTQANLLRNSRTGSIYIVKPKMHGSDEVAFACAVFARVELILGLEDGTIKIGIMDEERRTSVNLKACIHRARDRVMFINTGFLDRTGDEIHTSMEAGPVLPKGAMKNSTWIAAYEDNNVDVGLACGLPGRAQIGKGMWAMPDLMARMLQEKIGHPQSGASTAWVPSPTAAVLHALHYHSVDVTARQETLRSRAPPRLEDMLTLPLLDDPGDLDDELIQRELDNNAQGILGYVVRWVEQGIGCSKVPDINDVGLMEDRATLRISSQHIANWLKHGLCSAEQVEKTLQRMAAIVDGQNADDPHYRPMTPDFDASFAFQAARSLVFDGTSCPNGYTEPTLHEWRLKAKIASS